MRLFCATISAIYTVTSGRLHNALANYYRKCGGTYTIVSLETVQNSLFSDSDLLQNAQRREDSKLLRSEIAKLTEIQRTILTAYYYENKTKTKIKQI